MGQWYTILTQIIIKTMEILYIPLHILSLIYAAWNIFHAEHLRFNWIRGKAEKLDAITVAKYHKGTWTGLILAIVTGILAFLSVRSEIVYPQFYIKMGFVIVIIANSFAIGSLSKIPTQKTFASLSTQEKLPLMLSSGLSFLSWGGALIMASFIVSE